MPPTPQYAWPQLAVRAGCEVWLKHENHTPLGAFKVRGGLVHAGRLKAAQPGLETVIAATRGNHGQSVAFAAGRCGLKAVVVVPHGNSPGKNAAMRALGAKLIEHGHDFQAALDHAAALAAQPRTAFFRSFHPDLVEGVASYALELFRGAPPLEAVYVPIGLGSGICGVIAARDALGLKTEVIGVVAEQAPCYARSFAARRPIATDRADTLADGMACRVPVPEALDMIWRGVARIVTVGEADLLRAIAWLFADTHNLAEGAGAAPLAALLTERERMRGRRVGLILSGGNLDADLLRQALALPC
jgi:threonine dehydratase